VVVVLVVQPHQMSWLVVLVVALGVTLLEI
jgi:hypothetical protein